MVAHEQADHPPLPPIQRDVEYVVIGRIAAGRFPVILYMSKAHMWVSYDLRRYVNRLLGTLEILGNSREFTNNSCGARHRKNYVLREFTGNSQLTTREFKSWRIQRQLNIRKNIYWSSYWSS